MADGRHHPAARPKLTAAVATGNATPADFRRGASLATPTASQAPIFAVMMHRPTVFQACAADGLVGGRVMPATKPMPATALSTGAASPADLRRGTALATTAATASVKERVTHRGFAFALAAASGTSLAQSNVDVLAPASRAMTISVEERAMFAPEENRTMTVEA